MATVLKWVCPVANPLATKAVREDCGFVSQKPKFHTLSRVLDSNKVSISPRATVRAVPSLVLEEHKRLQYIMGKGLKPNPKRAADLLVDLVDSKHFNKAIIMMEMIIDTGSVQDVSAYVPFIRALCRVRMVDVAMQLVSRMEDKGYQMTIRIYHDLMRSKNFNTCMKLFDSIIEKGVHTDWRTYNAVLVVACRQRGVDEAMKVMDEIIARGGKLNVVNYNVLMNGLSKEGRNAEAIRFFREYPGKGIRPDTASYNIILGILCREERWDEARKVLEEMEVHDKYTYNVWISALCNQGRTEEALKLLDEMRRHKIEPDAMYYNPIISQLCKEKKVDLVLNCLDQMGDKHCSPNWGTYLAISVLCVEGMAKEASSLIEILGNRQSLRRQCFVNDVILCFCTTKKTYQALQLLYEMTICGFTPDSRTYSILIMGMCKEGMLEEAVMIIKIMEESDCRPTADNFNTLIRGLCNARRTSAALMFVEIMIDKGHMPSERTYIILVEGLIEEGVTHIAANVVNELSRKQILPKKALERIRLQCGLK